MWLRDVDREENLCCSNVLGASKIASFLYIRLLLTHGYLYELIVQEIIFQASLKEKTAAYNSFEIISSRKISRLQVIRVSETLYQ